MKRRIRCKNTQNVAVAVLLATFVLSSCAGAGVKGKAYSAYPALESSDKQGKEIAGQLAGKEETEDRYARKEEDVAEDSSDYAKGADAENAVPNNAVEGEEADVNPADLSEKKIRTVNMSLECKNLDSAEKELKERVKTEGGYIESEDYSAVSDWNDLKTMNFTIRIPKEKVDSFLGFLNGEGRVISKSENLEDVRLQYRDAKNHIKALETEQERVLALMEKAETVDQLIALENRLTEIRYQLDSYHSEVLDYDNRVNFSTIYLDLQESIDGKMHDRGSYSFFDQVRDGFFRNMVGIRGFFTTIALFCLVFIPQILLVILFILGIVLLNKKLNKRKKEKQERKMEQEELAKNTEAAIKKEEKEAVEKEAVEKEEKEDKE